MSSPATGHAHFLSLPDLAARPAGGAVVWANDDLFAERENLIKPEPAEHRPATFGHKGQVYDGWETRRRRGANPDAHDSAIVRLGCARHRARRGGRHRMVHRQLSRADLVEAGYPSVEELVDKTEWTTVVERNGINGDTRNPFKVNSSRRWSHVRLSIYPDGGVARFRVHGEGLLDPRFTDLPLDLAALENGGRITACSNMFYSSPNNLLVPGAARTMGEDWETSRRRDTGNDWVQVHLAGQGVLSGVFCNWAQRRAAGVSTLDGPESGYNGPLYLNNSGFRPVRGPLITGPMWAARSRSPRHPIADSTSSSDEPERSVPRRNSWRDSTRATDRGHGGPVGGRWCSRLRRMPLRVSAALQKLLPGDPRRAVDPHLVAVVPKDPCRTALDPPPS